MFLDTSGLLCLLDAGERWHSDAGTYYRAAPTRLTHNYVLVELIALAMARNFDRLTTCRYITAVVRDPKVEVRWIDPDLHRRGVELLTAQLDKDYSLTDAVSFILMRERGILESLTTDHHFEQAGFVRLLK